MSALLQMLGEKGIIAVIGMIIFLFSYKYSQNLFTWIENQTLGTRNYILEELAKLHMEVKPEIITYTLLFVSIGSGLLTLLSVGVFVSWAIGLILAIIVSFIGFKIPRPFIDMLVQRRITQYDNQMVDALTLLANGIRAGLSVPQALGMVVGEMPAPISEEFNTVLQQNRIGVPLEESFENLAKRIPTPDNDMFVASMNILRETGGNLAEVFDTIVEIIRERIRLKQKIKQFTATGMMQGYVISAMPFCIGIVYTISDPEGMKPLFTTPLGIIILILAMILVAIGMFIIKKIVTIRTD